MDYKKFIDSVVGNIARKIEDEFNENDHPRDKGGKFTSKGGEGKGGSPLRQEHGFYGGEKVKQEDPKRGDELNKYAVKLEKAGVDPKEIHRLNREGDLEGMKKLLPETETEKAAKEELKSSSKSKIYKGARGQLLKAIEAGADSDELAEAAEEAFNEDPDQARDFLFGVDFDYEYDEQREEIEEDSSYAIEPAVGYIQNNPDKALRDLKKFYRDLLK